MMSQMRLASSDIFAKRPNEQYLELIQRHVSQAMESASLNPSYFPLVVRVLLPHVYI